HEDARAPRGEPGSRSPAPRSLRSVREAVPVSRSGAAHAPFTRAARALFAGAAHAMFVGAALFLGSVPSPAASPLPLPGDGTTVQGVRTATVVITALEPRGGPFPGAVVRLLARRADGDA